MRFNRLAVLLIISNLTNLLVAQSQNRIIIHADQGQEQISRYIYGHFAEHLGRCIYGGFWVGEKSSVPNTRGIRNDVIAALREIKPSVIRWPGGCFADTYHWKDGIGPREKRPAFVNTTWGGVTEDNSFGTHEFLDLCELVGAEPYICLNVGSGTVQEAAEWVEYVNSDAQSPLTELRRQNGRAQPWKVKFWAVGNESWGCGGNMIPEYYADLFKRFSTYLRFGDLYRVASGGLDNDHNWTEVLLQKTQKYQHLIQGYSFHYYTCCHGWDNKGSATQFTENDWFHTLKNTLVMEQSLERHIAIMDKYDPENKIGLIADEWGNWFNVEPGTNPAFLYQQNTLRDAVTAALYLNIYNNHARRVKMANIAQTINVLQAMLLTQAEKLVKTPSFYIFKMYQVHQDATLLPVEVTGADYAFDGMTIPGISVSASQGNQGALHISLCNLNPNEPALLSIELRGAPPLAKVTGEILTSATMQDYNDFGQPEKVNLKKFSGYRLDKNNLSISLPAKSVVTLEITP